MGRIAQDKGAKDSMFKKTSLVLGSWREGRARGSIYREGEKGSPLRGQGRMKGPDVHVKKLFPLW